MNVLNKNWIPEFGTIFTWFAMDKKGKIAVMVNNCFGNLPIPLLNMKDAEQLLDQLNEYIWQESPIYCNYKVDKKGNFSVDLYSAWRNRSNLNKEYIINELKNDLKKYKHYSEANLSVNKGFFVYYGIEGSFEGEDYPVGYDGQTKMGDYFRYLIPTVYASIEDFPVELRHGIAVSDTIDFMVDRVLDNDRINEYFTNVYIL